MAKVTILVDGEEREFGSKKAMLKQVSYWILQASDGPMTLRQLYYRFVAKDLLENKESQYSYLGEAVKEARIAGLIPWEWLEDRTRSHMAGDSGSTNPEGYFRAHLDHFKESPGRYERPRWESQPQYLEVWVEKEALAGVFEPVCRELGVVAFPNRGYTSVTLLKEAADRFEKARGSRTPKILYFGDFDPSGQDIERNIRDKLNDVFDVAVEVERMALNRQQIDERELPPQPAKSSDSRYEDFVEAHGDIAVELDALPPEELKRLVREAVTEHFDEDIRQDVLERQSQDREQISRLVEGTLNE